MFRPISLARFVFVGDLITWVMMLNEKLQVLRTIIVFLAIEVMNDFVTSEWTAYLIGHDQTMLQNITILISHAIHRMSWWEFDDDIPLCILSSTTLPAARCRAKMRAAATQTREMSLARNVDRHLPDRTIAISATTLDGYYPTSGWISLIVSLLVPVNDAAIRQHLFTDLHERPSVGRAALTTEAGEDDMDTAGVDGTFLTTSAALDGDEIAPLSRKSLRPEDNASIRKLLILEYALSSRHKSICLTLNFRPREYHKSCSRARI